MNPGSSIKRTFVGKVKAVAAVGWKDRSNQSLLFWLCALAALCLQVMVRGTIKSAAVVLICFILCLVCDRWKPRFLYQTGKGILVLLCLVFSIVSALLLFLYANVGDVDFACYTNVLWNTLHGHFLYHSFLNQNLMAVHCMPAILIFVPFYALLGNYGLVIAQSLAWAGGFWLLFSYHKPPSGAPLLLILAVALLPPLAAPLFYGFHPDILFLPVSAWALYAYKKSSFAQFFSSVVFLVLIKEVFVLAALYFAFLAFREKRPWYWSLMPAGCSVLIVSLFWFVLSPALRSGPSHVFTGLLPSSFSLLMEQLVSGNSMLFILLSFFMVLPALISHSIKFALFPLPFFLFYAVFPDQGFRDFWRHYALAGAWVALFSLSFCSTETLRRMAAPFFLISLCFSFSWIPLLIAPRASAEKRCAIKQAISFVSSDKKLVVHGPFITEASERHYIMNWIYASAAWQEYDYLLFDTSYRPGWWPGRDSLKTHIDRLIESPGWRPVFHQGSISLFKKNQ